MIKQYCDTCKYLNYNVKGDDKTTYCTKGYLPERLYPFEFGCVKHKEVKTND